MLILPFRNCFTGVKWVRIVPDDISMCRREALPTENRDEPAIPVQIIMALNCMKLKDLSVPNKNARKC